MLKPGQKVKLVVSVLLFGGYLLAMAMDLTGVGLHQWIGILLASLAGYHLLVHRAWVATVSKRFLRGVGHRAQALYAIDAALLVGFVAITVTGVVLSTWLNLPLAHYEAWRLAHVTLSVVTLWLVVVKVAMHWRWLASTMRRHFVAPTGVAPLSMASERSPAGASRRQFIATVGSVGALAAMASAWVLCGEVLAQAAAPAWPTSTTPATASEPAGDGTQFDARIGVPAEATAQNAASDASTPGADGTAPVVAVSAEATPAGTAATATAEPTVAQSASCTVRCRRACSYPGRCSRYVDSNGNGRCDWGECL